MFPKEIKKEIKGFIFYFFGRGIKDEKLREKIYPIVNLWLKKPHLYSYFIKCLLVPLKEYCFTKTLIDKKYFNYYKHKPQNHFKCIISKQLCQIFNYFTFDFNFQYHDYLIKKYIFVMRCLIIHQTKQLKQGLPPNVYKNVIVFFPILLQEYNNLSIESNLLKYDEVNELFSLSDENKIFDGLKTFNKISKIEDIINNTLFILELDIKKLNPSVKEFVPQLGQSDELMPESLHNIGISSAEFVLQGE